MNPSDRNMTVMYLFLIIVSMISQSMSQGINLALGKPVTMSSTDYYIFNWTGSLAVDGAVPGTQSIDDCRCCSGTQRNVDNWLTVDLGDIYTIRRINVQGRTENTNGRIHDTTLHILNTTGDTEQQVFTQQAISQTFTWTAPTGTLTRFVTLREPNYDWLIVCEIRVFKRDCVAGKYGPVCTQDCSDNCAGRICDQTRGHCDRCDPGKHGDTCTEPCPQHCAGDVCNKTDGYCTNGCQEGYEGQRCESGINLGLGKPVTMSSTEFYMFNWNGSLAVDGKVHVTRRTCDCQCCSSTQGNVDNWLTVDLGEIYTISSINVQGRTDGHCVVGKYGPVCSQDCSDKCASCDQTSGHCVQCIPGKYGDTCTEPCPQHCAGDVCDRTDGQCPNGCKEGYQGQRCESECDDGMYGQNCSLACVNCVTDRCLKDTGTCNDGCVEGFTGSFCTQPTVPVGPIVGSVVAVLIVAIVIVFVFLFVRRHRQKQDRTERPENASRSRGNEAFEGNITEESNNSQNKYDFLDLGEHQGQENPYSEINAARQECIYEGTSSDIRDTELQDMYQRLSDIKLETRSAELEMKKRRIEDEIRKAEKKLAAIKKEVESGKKKKRNK